MLDIGVAERDVEQCCLVQRRNALSELIEGVEDLTALRQRLFP